ncbi:L-lactate dehydrogenase [Melipona quadrifasciata]|uniref:L-lactate dehydrogenase n=1 Tax=Melipona quadrifasciata TaxID=166423 RepID=A0A0M9A5K8_9HYME|nr:L-lactate dehydrogenase [Melipona quadrifasciata]
MASEVCLIDHDANKASAEAEDIQHVGVFLGCPLITGTSVPIWSSIHVGGMKLRDINPRIGEQDDPEKWYEIADKVKNVGAQLEGKKGSCCWGVAVSTAEIVDAIVRNTKVVLPASTHILSCAHGTDKDVYMSVPCVIGREGVYCTVRQKLSEQEKSAVQTCADSIRGILRECGILQETNNEVEQ